MNNLFDPAKANEIKDRLGRLKPDTQPQWGRMNVAQAVEHCSLGMEWAVADTEPPRMFLSSILGRVIKPFVLGNDEPMRRNSPTVTTLLVAGEPDLDRSRERLCTLIDRFVAAGPEGCTRSPHSFFGRLTPDQWAILTYKHIDHHLRQFGV